MLVFGADFFWLLPSQAQRGDAADAISLILHSRIDVRYLPRLCEKALNTSKVENYGRCLRQPADGSANCLSQLHRRS